MHQSPARRPRARLLVPVTALAVLLALPAVASADVSTTQITAPGPNAVLEGSVVATVSGGVTGSPLTTVSGTAPGAADGDTVDIFCDVSFYGLSQVAEISEGPVTITDGRFSSSDVVVPQLPCTLRAVPTDEGVANNDSLTAAQQAAYTGPPVLAGQYVAFGITPGATAPNFYRATSRGQTRGVAQYNSAGSVAPAGGGLASFGGLAVSYTSEDTNLRSVFYGSGMLGWFGGTVPAARSRASTRKAPDVDLADAGLVVDGRPAVPFLGSDTGEFSSIVSHEVDPATGNLTLVETAPIVFTDGPTPGAVPAVPGLPPTAGLRLRRSVVQDHDGRQSTFRDTLEATDDAAHHVEVRYSEGVTPPVVTGPLDLVQTAPPAFRVPWTSGDAYTAPSAGDAIAAAPAGPATIYAHAPQFGVPARARATARAASGPGGPEGAFTFDAAPSDGRFLSSSSFVIRFVRDVPAGGSTAIRHVYSQDPTQDGLDRLVDDALGRVRPTTPPDPPLPGAAPLPTSPAPGTPASIIDPTERLSLAARGLLLKPRLARYVRDGRRSSLVLSRAPAGRYTVAIRRYVRNGRTLASGAVTRTSAGTVKIAVHRSHYGARYLDAKRRRGETQVKVRVEVSYTAPGQKTKRVKKIRVVQFE